jgi:hypothetical protein
MSFRDSRAATVSLRCLCGEVHGEVANASPASVNHAVCYCSDCQAFAHHLKQGALLDPKGGSDIVQVAPARLTFVRGRERIAGLRLSPRGLYRFHSTCCNTPLGNTVGPAIPFVGLLVQVFEQDGQKAEALFGPPSGAVHGEYAIGGAPEGSKGVSLRMMARAVRLVGGWKLGGKSWPHPFFDRNTRAPLYPVTVLSKAERDALRPLCGPNPRVVSP